MPAYSQRKHEQPHTANCPWIWNLRGCMRTGLTPGVLPAEHVAMPYNPGHLMPVDTGPSAADNVVGGRLPLRSHSWTARCPATGTHEPASGSLFANRRSSSRRNRSRIRPWHWHTCFHARSNDWKSRDSTRVGWERRHADNRLRRLSTHLSGASRELDRQPPLLVHTSKPQSLLHNVRHDGIRRV
jgi:hypothetical protein